MRIHRFLVLALFAGCTGGSSQQVVTGKIATGFPDTISAVKVLHGTQVVASAPVAADGSFQLSVPASSGLTLRLVGSGHSNVVMPRKSGALDATFTVRAGGVPFDLGNIYYVGSSTSTHFAFHSSGTIDDECDDDDHDATGATCVADDDSEDGDSCEAADSESETNDSLSSPDDGSGSASGSASDDDGADDGDSVPEHDFPEDGCAGSGSGSGSGSSGSGSGSSGPA